MRDLGTYKSWSGMKQRCDNPNNGDYDNYGGRGITYDPEWEFYRNFLRDMGIRPDGMSLDRIDNTKGYCKENCRWADSVTQNNNRRERRTLTEARPNNRSTSVLGVSLEIRKGREWRVVSYYDYEGSRVHLYRGQDMFEAFCKRKSYEARWQ